MTLQDAYLDSGVSTPNCAFYGPFVFDQRSRRHILRAELNNEHSLKQSINQLEIVENQLRSVNKSFLQHELLWTIKTMKLASHIAIGYIQHQCREVENFPESLKRQLDSLAVEIESEYANLWQEKYRIGGCKHSLSRLQYLRKLLS